MRRELESDPDRAAVLSRFVASLSNSDERLLRGLLTGELADELPGDPFGDLPGSTA
jgi:hypothetical protein